eukprot:Unigene3025_Nuclearia_a/m.9303 Unigene3025_Nuclearia_a/g.9303  ORF Unigene3025_Nuclearia_a/g.9303 Unigene3025_Nuclearia_a/m.9303 type:complete len:440 (+) Unigene3025_Nuclearia_a:51-1370(+)
MRTLAIIAALAAVVAAIWWSRQPGDAWAASPTVRRARAVDELVVPPELPPAELATHLFATQRTPAVLRRSAPASPVRHWAALERWTWPYLAARIDSATAYVQAERLNRHWTPGTRMQLLLNVSRPHEPIDVSGASLAELVAHAGADGPYLYWSTRLEYFPALAADVDVRALRGARRHSLENVWVSSRGLIVQAHYDLYNNMFVQVRGRKRFLLFPPEDRHRLYVFPQHHPYARRSQVDILAPDLARHPNFAEATPYEVVVHPGDLLVLPPCWFHFIESLDASVSVNVFSFAPEIEDAVKVYAWPVPVAAQRSVSARALVLAQVAQQVLATVLGKDGSDARAFARELFKARLAPLGADATERALRQPLVCDLDQLHDAADRAYVEQGPDAALAKYTADVVALLARPAAPYNLYVLEDWLQSAVERTLGSDHLVSFLLDCL